MNDTTLLYLSSLLNLGLLSLVFFYSKFAFSRRLPSKDSTLFLALDNYDVGLLKNGKIANVRACTDKCLLRRTMHGEVEVTAEVVSKTQRG